MDPLLPKPEASPAGARLPAAPAAPPAPADGAALRLRTLWIAWFLAMLFHTDLGLMPLFHGLSPEIESHVDPARLPAVFGAMLGYYLVPLAALVLIAYAETGAGSWRRWRWFHLGLGLLYSATNIVHLGVDIVIPDSRPDQVALMGVLVLLGLLINLESWHWCRAPSGGR